MTRRDADGRPVWNAEYEAFMRTVGFETKLCKPSNHELPVITNKVERGR